MAVGPRAGEGDSTGKCISFLGWHNKSLLREGRPLPGPECGFLSNTQKWIVQGDTRANKARDCIEKVYPVESSSVRETRKTALPCGSLPQILWWWNSFPRLSLANVFDSGSFLVVHAMLNPEGFQGEWCWVVGRTLGVSSLHLTFPEFFRLGLFVSFTFLTRTSCCKIAHASGYCCVWSGRWFQSVAGSPNNTKKNYQAA